MGPEFNSKEPNMGESLCEELIEEILSRLPITSLINCKYVSKSWSRLVSNACYHGGPTVGLIGLYSNIYPCSSRDSTLVLHPPLMKQEDDNDDDCDDDDDIIDIHDEIVDAKLPKRLGKRKRDIIMETTKCLDDPYPLINLLDSCNGLILGRSPGYFHYYYVGNPILNQWARLPRSLKQGHCVFTTGFAFDGIQGNHYKILQLPLTETLTNRIQCHIFSSETGQWKKHQAPILNSLITLSHCVKLTRELSIQYKHGLYRNGALHWTFTRGHKYMLVFYVEKEVFRFMELPRGCHDQNRTHEDDRVDKCLWESRGFLHYAVSDGYDTFHVWKNMNDGNLDDKQHRWVHIRTVRYHTMRSGYLDDPKVLICTYDGCSRSLNHHNISILCVPDKLEDGSRGVNLGTILTYLSSNGVLEENSAKRLTVRWRYMRANRQGMSQSRLKATLYPYVFNLVDLPMWDGCTLLKHPKL